MVDKLGMPDFHTLRDHVFARLGSPEPLLPGERYRTGNHSTDWAHRRWEAYLDAVEDHGFATDLALVEEFVAELEAKRARDFRAFHHGRSLLLSELPVLVDAPHLAADLDAPPTDPHVAHVAVGGLGHAKIMRRRRAVLTRLGRPPGWLPGENYVFDDCPHYLDVLARIEALEFDRSDRSLDAAIEWVAGLRARDPQAFWLGRKELLGLLPITVEIPREPARAC